LSSMANFNIELGSLSIKEIPVIVFTILGFVINLSVILLLVLMSYSHKFHNLIMHYGIGLLSRLKIVKNPDHLRESLRIQVENFKIELRRLQSNIPVTILIMFLFTLSIVSKYSIPWLAGIALNAYNDTVTGALSFTGFWDGVFLSSYHQMITGLIPLPGSAGVSEYFFLIIFNGFYDTYANTIAAQIIWRTATFHLVILFAGLVTAFYRSSPKEHLERADRQTFIDLQLQTYEERKRSADTLYETARLSRKEVQNKLRSLSKMLTSGKKSDEIEEALGEEVMLRTEKQKPTKNKASPTKKKPTSKKKKPLTKKKSDEPWDSIEIK
ncbi:MAG: YbhN family protein, partial [Bacilli bacterium]